MSTGFIVLLAAVGIAYVAFVVLACALCRIAAQADREIERMVREEAERASRVTEWVEDANGGRFTKIEGKDVVS